MQLILMVLCGESGSGKSTTAKELHRRFPHAVLLEIDKMRPRYPNMTHAELQMQLIRDTADLLRMNRHVIVDACNTHVHDKIRWETVAECFNAALTWVDMPTPLEICIERDSKREQPVGAKVIQMQRAMRAHV